MNTTNKFFETKQQYLAFRKAFASAINDPRAKKTFTDGKAQVWDDQTRKYSTIATKIKHSGWLQSEHFLLFNLVCGRDFFSGFSPKTKKIFIESGGSPDRALLGAISSLSTMIAYAKNLMDTSKIHVPSWRTKDKDAYIAESIKGSQNSVNTFLEPFGGTITLADLARLELPLYNAMNDAKKKEIIGKTITYAELLKGVVPTPAPKGMSQTTETYIVVKKEVPEKKGLLSRMFS